MIDRMPARGFTLFDTAIGRCGIAWGERGVLGVQLPERSEAAARARLLRRCPDAAEATPPPDLQRAIDGIVALLAGEASDLTRVGIEMDHLPDFDRRVYDMARSVPPGATVTYGEIAARLGEPGQAQAVGQALGQNPFPVIVPCHRVMAAGGKLGGFSAHGGAATKRRLLAIEAVHAKGPPNLFD